MRKCKIENCDRIHFGKGYCKRHYHMMGQYGVIKERTMRDQNPIEVFGDIVKIALCDRLGNVIIKTTIDEADYFKIKNYKWYLQHGYVMTSKGGKAMHRIIMNANSEDKIDHKDGNPLNNRKKNLRICTQSQNMWNSKIAKNNTSGFKGVSWYKCTKRWVAYIGFNNEKKMIGYFNSKIDAARAYNVAAKKYFGEFARVNRKAITHV